MKPMMKHLFRILSAAFLFAAFLSCNKQAEQPQLTEGVVAVSRVTIDGKYASLNRESSSFLATLPTTTDFSALKVSIDTDAQEILIDNHFIH